MPVTYQIDTRRPWLEMKLSGHVTLQELSDCLRELYGDSDYNDDMPGIIDITEMTNLLSISELRGLAQIQSTRPGPPGRGRRAVIAASPAQYSTTRVFIIFAENSPIQVDVFYNRETALQWVHGD
jgi:hypothetical protein